MDGFLLINKEKNITSFGVVKEVKRQLNMKKVGHSGTLDPQTEGLLVIALGKGTKFLKEITDNSQKTYVATMKFGVLTTTGDIYGEILKEQDYILNKQDLIAKMNSFIKTYEQIPPKYSAKKINGKRAYKYAFAGEEVDMSHSAKEVTIHNLNILNINKNEVVFEVDVSKGTYIRSLITDIAYSMGTIATMTSLKRTFTDGFSLDEACKIEDDLTSNIISLEKFIQNHYEGVFEAEDKLLSLITNGSRFENPNIVKKFDNFVKDDKILFVDKNTKKKIAIYKKENNIYTPLIML